MSIFTENLAGRFFVVFFCGVRMVVGLCVGNIQFWLTFKRFGALTQWLDCILGV